MTTETNNEDPPQGEAEPKPDDGIYKMSRAEAEKLFKVRDEAKQLREYKAAKEKQEREAEEAMLLQEKEYQKLLEQKDAELASFMEKEAQRAKADAERERQDRRTKFLDAVERQSKLKGKRAVLDGLLSVMERNGFDAAPEDIADQSVGDAVKRMQELDPDTFKPKDIGAKGAPGNSHSDPKLSARAQEVMDLAQRMSPRQKRAG